jgi:putative component of toxin-antitoxin plasmid stabilization module
MKKELRTYRTKEEKEPFTEWLESLKDRIGKAHITNRLDRALVTMEIVNLLVVA